MTLSAPNFIIHAAGSVGNRPDLGKRPYRLHCRFRVPAYSGAGVLEKAKYAAAEQFITDMAQRGYEYIGESGRLPLDQRGFRMAFKGAHVEIRNQRKPKRPPSSREMLPAVMQGARFQSEGEPSVFAVPHYTESEFWDYDISAVFLHETILAEILDLREERKL